MSRISPPISAPHASRAELPILSTPNLTGTLPPSAAASSSTNGASESAGSNFPFGRPRCDIITIRAFFVMSSLSVGSNRMIRVLSVTFPATIGTFRSIRTSTILPDTSASSRVLKLRAITVLFMQLTSSHPAFEARMPIHYHTTRQHARICRR